MGYLFTVLILFFYAEVVSLMESVYIILFLFSALWRIVLKSSALKSFPYDLKKNFIVMVHFGCQLD